MGGGLVGRGVAVTDLQVHLGMAWFTLHAVLQGLFQTERRVFIYQTTPKGSRFRSFPYKRLSNLMREAGNEMKDHTCDVGRIMFFWDRVLEGFIKACFRLRLHEVLVHFCWILSGAYVALHALRWFSSVGFVHSSFSFMSCVKCFVL